VRWSRGRSGRDSRYIEQYTLRKSKPKVQPGLCNDRSSPRIDSSRMMQITYDTISQSHKSEDGWILCCSRWSVLASYGEVQGKE
jgi:hypothetical protein